MPSRAAPPAPSLPPVVSKADLQREENELSGRVLEDLQKQLELMLEVRLREVLAPVLSRAADTLIRDARKELTSTLRDAVARSVAQELARRRSGR